MLMLVFTLLAAPAQNVAEKGLVCRTEQISQAAQKKDSEKTKPVLQESLNSGKFIRLSDDTLWEINPKDTAITQSWITPVEITTAPSGNPDYPVILTNTLTGSKVHARRAQAVPSTPAPAKK